jgi:hypothetical protein
MKASRNVKLFTAILLIGLSAGIFAKGPKTEKSFQEKYIKGAEYALGNDLPSVVESSIFVSMEIKDRFPAQKYDHLINKLENLARDGQTVSIRYKAGLAVIYFNYYDLFKEIKIDSRENPDQYFKSITNKIENNFFALN